MLVSYDPFYPTPDGVKTALDIDMCQGLDDAMVDTHLTTKKTDEAECFAIVYYAQFQVFISNVLKDQSLIPTTTFCDMN